MDSNTKTTFAPELIESLAKAQFGTATRIAEIVPLTAGWFNTAYSILFSNLKPDVVLRIAPHHEQRVLTYEHALMRREVEIIETVQRIADVPIPRLLGYDFSRRIVDRDYMFLERLSGTAFNEVKGDLPPECVEMLDREVGRVVARLAEVRGPSFGYFGDGPGCGATSWRAAFMAIVDALLQDGVELGAQVPLPWDELRSLIAAHAPSLDAITEPSLVHWDIWAGNVYVRPQNGSYVVEGIIDWERALWGDPDMETAVACRFYGPSFYEGYGKQLSSSGPEAVRQSLYRLYLWLVMVIEAKVRFEDADHLPWARDQLRKELAWLEEARAYQAH
jgi:aminoglycoside phosphotransferase (APT) family kinase protein